jgi:hypothetical protein
MTPDQLLGVPSWPFAKPDRQSPAYAAIIAATITNGLTIIDPAQLTGDTTLNLTINPDLRDGAKLVLKVSASTNGFDLTPGTGFSTGSPDIVGVAAKTKIQKFILIDGKFTPESASFQIN